MKNKCKKVTIGLLSLGVAVGAAFGLAGCNGGSNDNGKEKPVPSNGLEYTVNGDEASVTGIGTCTDAEICIADTYQGKPVTSIGAGAFEFSDVTSVILPDSIKIIDIGAFDACNSLTSINIPNSVTSISEAAFGFCYSLTSITIPKSVTSISETAFAGCGLTSITVASGNTKYEVTGNCLIERESKMLIAGCNNSVIPTDGSVTSIGAGAFARCKKLTSISIPNSVTRIGEMAFAYCESLESITVASGNTKYHSAGNCLIETESKTLIVGCKNSVIPTDGSVTSIGDSAFIECKGLASITIPSCVTIIDSHAFSGCSAMTSITIPNGVKNIKDDAFSYCSSLTSITLPTSIKSVGHFAFSGCSSLTSINFVGTQEQWNAIEKESGWNSGTGEYTIYFNGGTSVGKNG